MDDPLLEDNNVVEVVTRFEKLISQQISFTAGEDVAIMGASDFSGENAHVSLSRKSLILNTLRIPNRTFFSHDPTLRFGTTISTN